MNFSIPSFVSFSNFNEKIRFGQRKLLEKTPYQDIDFFVVLVTNNLNLFLTRKTRVHVNLIAKYNTISAVILSSIPSTPYYY